MSRIAYCPACSADANGIKSRLPLEHTCGLGLGDINPNLINKYPYEKESLDREYRGTLHCKACADEQNGLKSIQAAKHTCRKNKK